LSNLYDVGETAFITIYTRDGDGAPVDADSTPVATLTPLDPPGPATTPVIAHPDVGAYTVAATLPAAGEYSLRTVATWGGSTRVDVRRLAALPPETNAAALPAWAPSLTDVADHIPTRTRPTAEWGASDEILGTFTDATTPTREQVARLIRRACSWVTGQIGAPVSPTAYGVAAVAAALRTAYWVEIGFPERDADLAVYDRLATEADAATATALRVNVATGAEDPTAGALDDLVLYEFPRPPAWADRII
jgi:hypothetical protein